MADKITECVSLIENLSASERKELIDELNAKVEAKASAKPDTNKSDLIAETLDEIAGEKVRITKNITRNSYLQQLRTLESKAYIREQFADNPLRGIEAMLAGVQSIRTGSRNSVESAQESLKSMYTDGFLRDLLDADLEDAFKKGTFDADIYEYVYLKGSDEGVSQGQFVKEVETIGDLIIKWDEAVRLDANDAGASIRRMRGYVTRQSHDMVKVRSTPKQQWIDEIKPLLDVERMAKEGENPDVYLAKVYDSISTGDFMKEDMAVMSSTTVNVGKAMSKSRVLHFKDGKSAYQYNNKYGTGTLRESLFQGFDRSASGTGMMRVLGPNPERTINDLLTYSKTLLNPEDANYQKRLNGLNKAFEKGGSMRNLFSTINGEANIPGNVTAARIGTITRNVNTMASLGGAVLSAFGDLTLFSNEYRRLYGSWFEGMARAPMALLNGVGIKSHERKMAASMVGVYSRSVSGITMTRFSAGGDMAGRSTELTNKFFRANLLGWWTDTLRESFAVTMSHKAALQKDLKFDDLDDAAKQMMGGMGITAKDWEVIRHSQPVDFQGDELISALAVNDIDDATMRTLLADEVDRIMAKEGGDKEAMIARLVRRRKSEIAAKWQGYIIDRSEHAVIHPDAKTRATLQRGLKPGTVEGEFFRAFAQFKGFGVAILQKGLGSQLAERGVEFDQDAIRSSLFKGFKSNPAQITQTIMMMTAMGYLSMSAKDALKGRKPRSLDDPKTYRDSLLQGGSLGLVGDLFLNPVPSRSGGGWAGFVLGPTGSDIADSLELMRKAAAGEKLGKDSLDLIAKNFPANNLFYTKPFLDYVLLDSLYDQVSPGYKKRSERRLSEEGIVPLETTLPEAIFGEK